MGNLYFLWPYPNMVPTHLLSINDKKTGANKDSSASNATILVSLFTPVYRFFYLYVQACTRLIVTLQPQTRALRPNKLVINFTKYVIFVRRSLTQLSGEHCGINQLSFPVHLLYDYDFDIFI